MREIDILRQINQKQCENLVHVWEVFDETDAFYIIMEICNYDLKYEFEMLKKQKTWYIEKEQIEIIQQIVNGFKSLFSMNIIHRDIKPSNVLVKIVNANSLQPKKIYKITDFGFSRILENLSERGQLSRVGTPAYVAPQLFFDNEFSGKCDIYSYGLVFYQLTHGGSAPPIGKSTEWIKNYLSDLKIHPLKCNIQDGIYKQQLSNIIERMLIYREEERINFQDIFTHPLMNINYRDSDDSVFLRIFQQPDKHYLLKKNELEEQEKIQSRLERINTILSVFFRKFLFFENCIQQYQNHKQDLNAMIIQFYLHLLALNQLTYAMAMMHANLSDIHPCFKQDNDILHLIEIILECKEVVQDYFEKNRFRNIISQKYFEQKKKTREFSDQFKLFLIKGGRNQIVDTYLGLLANSLIKKINYTSIYESLSQFEDFPMYYQ